MSLFWLVYVHIMNFHIGCEFLLAVSWMVTTHLLLLPTSSCERLCNDALSVCLSVCLSRRKQLQRRAAGLLQLGRGRQILIDSHCAAYRISIDICSRRVPSVLWHCWLDVRKSIQPVKIEWWGVDVVIYLEQGADCLHMVQLMPLHPRTPSSLTSFKSRLFLPFWYRLTHVVLEKRPLNGCSSSSSRSAAGARA